MGPPLLTQLFHSPAAVVSAKRTDGESWEVGLKHNGPLGRTVVSETADMETLDVHTQPHVFTQCL